jgi:hypothetical protein
MSSWTCDWPQPKLHGKCCLSTCRAPIYVCRDHNATWCLRAQGCHSKKETLYCPKHSVSTQYVFKSLEDMQWQVCCLGQHEAPEPYPRGYRALGPEPPKHCQESSGGPLASDGESGAWGAAGETEASPPPPPAPAPNAGAARIPAPPLLPPPSLPQSQPAIAWGPSVAVPRAFEPPAVNVGVNSGNVMVSAADPRDQLLQGALARIQMLESVVQQVPFLMVNVQDLQQRLGRLESQVGATSTAGAA